MGTESRVNAAEKDSNHPGPEVGRQISKFKRINENYIAQSMGNAAANAAIPTASSAQNGANNNNPKS